MSSDNLSHWKGLISNFPVWEAPTIDVRFIWDPIMKKVLRIYHQKPKTRPTNLCVVGYTNTGKTTCFSELIPALIELENLGKFGIITITCQTNATLKGLYEQILDELQWPYSRSDNIQRLEKSLKPAFINRKTRLLVIDEFSQLQNRRNEYQQYEVLKALRNIPQWTKRPIIIIGTSIILDLLEKDNDTNNRFSKIEFPRFRLDNGLWRHFHDVIKTLDNYLYDTKGISSPYGSIENGNFIETLFEASKGKMGALIKIYEKTVEYALENNELILNEAYLDESIKELTKDKLLYDSDNVQCNIPDKWWEG